MNSVRKPVVSANDTGNEKDRGANGVGWYRKTGNYTIQSQPRLFYSLALHQPPTIQTCMLYPFSNGQPSHSKTCLSVFLCYARPVCVCDRGTLSVVKSACLAGILRLYRR